MGFQTRSVLNNELVPTYLRGTGNGMFAAAGHLGQILGTLSFGSLLDVYCIVPLLLAGGSMLLGGMLTLLLPNTTHIDLI